MQLNKDEIQKSKLVVALWDADLLSQDDYMSGVSMQFDISVLNVIGLRLNLRYRTNERQRSTSRQKWEKTFKGNPIFFTFDRHGSYSVCSVFSFDSAHEYCLSLL
jgi:hypothetical protein